MSWISGLADKAEQILTTIDQNAAEKLQRKKQTKLVEVAKLTEVTSLPPSPEQQRPKPSPAASPAKKWLPQVKSSPSLSRQSQDEEELIDFLNDSSKPTDETNRSKEEAIQVEGESDCDLSNEKQMLKNEVRVLNNELSLLLHRTRAAEKETDYLKSNLQDAENSQMVLREEIEKLVSQVQHLEHQNQTLEAERKHLESHQSEVEEKKVLQFQQQIQALRDKEECLTQSLESKDREYGLLKRQHQQELDSLNQQLTESRIELDQYRVRAQRTLSDKEALISQLRTNTSDDAVHASLQTELAQLREERRQLSEELADARALVEATRSQVKEGEQALAKVREAATASRRDLTDLAAAESQRCRILEDDCHLQAQELRLVREELAGCRSQLSMKEAELQNRPLTPAAAPALVPRELEHRLSSLTKTLIHKQTALESATTECNQLRMQLEELEHKHREHLMLIHQTRVVGANDTDDAKAQVPSFLVESPLDTGVARRVKRAYSSLDAVSIRTGVFLRRYPLARIFVVLYVIVLHSLVLMVLYSRTPDNTPKFPKSDLS